ALRETARLQGLFTVRVPSDVEGAWDTIGRAVAAVDHAADAGSLYLIDDVDAVLARFPAEYQLELAELLTRLLREGPPAGIRTVMTAARATAGIQSLVALCDSRLMLRMPNRQEHALAGGDGADYDPDLPPGGGSWRGHRVQVAAVEARAGESGAASRAEWWWHSGGFAVVASGTRRLTGAPFEVIDIAAQADRAELLDIGD